MKKSIISFTLALMLILVFSVTALSEEPGLSLEMITKQVSERFGEFEIRRRNEMISSFGSVMKDDQIIVFEMSNRIILFINFKEAKKSTYMWVTDSVSDEVLHNLYETLHAYAECTTISDNTRCFYMYVDDYAPNTFYLSTNDGTRFNEGEEFYPTIDKLIGGVVEKNHSEMSKWVKTLLD